MPAIRRTDSCTAARLRARPSSSTPVPRPTHAAVSPPASAAAIAADGVVLPMPISPSTSRSQSSASTASIAVCTTASKRRSVSAALEADVAGRMADADVDRGHLGADDTGEGVDRRAPFAVRGRASPRSPRSGRRSPSWPRRRRGRRRRSARPVGRIGRPVGSLPAGDPGGDLVEPRQRTARSQDVGGAVVDRGAGGLVGCGQIDELVVEAGSSGWPFRISSRTMERGSSRRKARRRPGEARRSARAAQRWFTEPRTSRYRRPRAVSGWTPMPTSFVTTTTGFGRRRGDRGRVGAELDRSRRRCGRPTSGSTPTASGSRRW